MRGSRHIACSALLFAVSCSVIVSPPELQSCESALDCYAVSSDNPFACWRCDRSLEGGSCVAAGEIQQLRAFDVTGPAVARLRAFTAAGELTVIAEQDPVLGRSVVDSVAQRFSADLTAVELPLLQGDAVVSQLAVANDAEVDWCVAVDHRDDSAGHLCLGHCDGRDCSALCEACSYARQPSLAVQHCGAADGDCEKLLAYLDLDRSEARAQWIEANGSAHSLSLPGSLDPSSAPLSLRVQRGDQTRFVLAASERGVASPWLGLVTAADTEIASGVSWPSEAHGELLDLAAAAADGEDARGQLLLAWVWTSDGKKRLSVATTAWGGSDRFETPKILFERALSGESSVSVAYAHYGIGSAAGGWLVAFRDGSDAFALRVDNAESAAARQPRKLAAAGVADLEVAAHPAGREASSPFVYIERIGEQARVQACKQ